VVNPCKRFKQKSPKTPFVVFKTDIRANSSPDSIILQSGVLGVFTRKQNDLDGQRFESCCTFQGNRHLHQKSMVFFKHPMVLIF
jgi:hypothetical protein